MNSSWEASQLFKDQSMLSNIPDDLIFALQKGTDAHYLDAIANLALNPAYTSLVFVIHEDIFVEICSRWISVSRSSGDPFLVLAALARVLPLAPHLSVFLRTLLHQQAAEISQAFCLMRITGLQEDSGRSLYHDLLTILRILFFDNEGYASLVSPAQIQLMLGRPHRPTQYLAIRVLCLYLHASDTALEKMIHDYIGVDVQIEGDWEDKTIDYFFLDLWETRRLKNLRQMLEATRVTRRANYECPKAIDIIKARDLSSTTARIGDVLVPRHNTVSPNSSPIVLTKTTKMNLSLLAGAFINSSNILVTGPPGAGKTSLVRDLTHQLVGSSSIITLHLNEQTDAKLLVGVYTSDKSRGSFSWRPGVLTKAVTEGRLVVVEDLDRAPPDLLSTLLSLLERGELLVPNWGECIRAAPGFKLIATVRSFTNTKREPVTPGSSMIGIRHWVTVPILVPPDQELAEIIAHRYSVLASYIGKIMNVYSCLRDLNHEKAAGRAGILKLNRPYGPQDLFRWCARLEGLLLAAGVCTGREPISETTNDGILLEALDCFAGFLPPDSVKAEIVRLVAKELQFPAERVKFCLEARRPEYSHTDSEVRFGRASLPCRKPSHNSRPLSQADRRTPFALNTHALRFLESAGVAVKMAEPCLLVGETGTGKTAIIQQLAELTNTKLIVANLSQQSEAGDLLGGYKPMNMRTLAVPILEEFEDLFSITFSSKRNQRYIDTITRAVSKGRWTRALALWQEALQKIEASLNSTGAATLESSSEHQSKRRRMESSKRQNLKSRWENFGSKIQTFQMHLANGSKGFAFSFVEGNIVKAARSGHWVLLDEINLASSDTLESIADLLSQASGDGPSLLLFETGDAERLRAHKDFRLFGAMNPATDVGKRDLPASFRSRFTEIFIDSPDKNFENLVSVVKVCLGSHTHVDVRASSDIANVYVEIKQLAEQNLLVDGSNQKPHFSLRTLTRTLVYVTDIAPIYGLRRALYEGFCMSFLTLLSAESANLVVPIIEKHLLGSQRNSRAFLNQIPRPPEGKTAYVRFRHYWMAQGSFPIEEQRNFIVTPFVERNLLNLVRATMTRRFPVLLQGPTSSGKTSMIEYLAKISGNRFVRINNHEHTDLQEYLGTYVSGVDGSLQYKEGVLVRALREGSWIVLDELNLAATDVLEALNRLLDDNKELLIPETQQIVRPHENFMLFATQNPPGMYGGRKVLSRAFRNRFLELHFDDIPEEELETILRERCQIAPSYCTRIVAVYKRLSVLRQTGRLFEQRNSFATLRDLFRWALRDADDREQLAINGFLLLAERVRNFDERKAVKEIIEDVMKVPINESNIYSTVKTPQKGNATRPLNNSIVWTKSMCRLYVLVAEAFKNNEPVLLVGETGSGKTTICQVFAEHMHTHLHIVNAHQNLETGDLIGSQRPIRNKDEVNAQLAQKLAQVLNASADNCDDTTDNLPALLETYDALGGSEKSNISQERRLLVESSRIRSNALFEWVDGSLVHAMKTGEQFLLDEISLADDSVLERLNSVLEPGRMLFLAEKGTDDAPITASPGFQFCATMNPGGDYGKKELSPALRNRFTEIWVPNLNDKQELLEIARDKLAPRWADLAEPIIAFGTWFSLRYNPITPSTSIRDLLTWIGFLNASTSNDRYFAILHGAATVYIDSLGADPAAKLSIPANEVAGERQACLLQLSDIFKHDMISIYHTEHAFSLDKEKLAIGPFQLSLNHGSWQDLEYSFEASTTKANVLRIVRALQLPKPILLEGSPGVGKTTLISTIATAIGMPLTRINLSDQTDLMDLFGSDVPLEGAVAGNFGWRQAPFLRSMQKGEWVLLDEMNLASQSVLEGLNACLDHRGEIYVSELDQTFSKHPNFILFAAQNPRHQGGGRKGLPSSFVNRFTVIYVDEFTPQDQLMICRRAFPTCSDEVLDTVMQCITVISALFRNDPAIGVQGGPWEFNLRDAFRWLQLITSQYALLPAGSAADYQDLLFLQRLRTTQDAVTASRLLRAITPHVDKAHSYFHILGSSFLQVGLGLLSRCNSRPCQQYFGKVSSLPHLESIILCIQNKWPCLLVGSSGSGKTRAITQLADIIGAEVVTVHLNGDMDTMDLIGGYEQVDPQRKLANIFKLLKLSSREAIVERLLCKAPKANCLDALEDQLQMKSPDLPKLIGVLRDCAKRVAVPGFSSVADELHRIMLQSSEDTRARFEWVDGILMKALQEGSWLVLDNANLCSPSVLDRLNSLLEPNGSLIIHEHHSADGSAHIVKPHPSFRLFMTTDPRHGELSRAMRNRSLELYFPAAASSELTIEPGCISGSSLARYQMFDDFDWISLADAFVVELAATCLDHLALSDFPLSDRWIEQVHKGLLPLPLHHSLLFSHVVELYDSMMKSQPTLFQSIQDRYADLTKALSSDVGWLNYNKTQTIHPMGNPALIQISTQDDSGPSLSWLGSMFDISLTLCKFGHRLETLKEAAKTKLASQMSRLEKSFAPAPKARCESTLPVGALLQEIEKLVRHSLSGKALEQGDQKWLDVIEKLLSYLNDIADVVEASQLDEGVFQTYRTIGILLAFELTTVEALKDLGEAFSRGMEMFDESWRLSYGQSMERLWSFFDSATARSLSELDLRLQVEELSDRFELLSWSSGGSIEQLDALRGSISCVSESICVSLEHNKSLQEVRNALDYVENSQKGAEECMNSPFFQAEFEGLRQYRECVNGFDVYGPDTLLDLLACWPAKQSMRFGTPSHAYKSLICIGDCTGISRPGTALITVRGTLAISTLQKINRSSEVPIRSLDLLSNEIEVLGNRTALLTDGLDRNQQQTINGLVASLCTKILLAHEDFLDPTSLSACIEHITELTKQPSTLKDPQMVLLFKPRPGSSNSDYFRKTVREYFNPSLKSLHDALQHQTGGETSHETTSSAFAWINMFMGCLALYVPNRPFDPASKPLVERDRHRKRKMELQNKLEALVTFERAFTGQTTNLRCQLLQHKLQSLGDERQVREIARPPKSNLAALQAVFNGILKSVVEKAPSSDTLQCLCQGDSMQKPEVELLRSNIARFISRLKDDFRAYDDITSPLVAMLQGLDVGLALVMIAHSRANAQISSASSIYCFTPFLGMRPDYPYNTEFELLRNKDPESRLMYLQMATVVRTITSTSKDRITSLALETYHVFYTEWKQQLTASQRENATKSSLYRYRGIEEDQGEGLADIMDVFSNSETVTLEATRESRMKSDPRAISQSLACIQREMFRGTKTASQRILGMLKDAASRLGALPENMSEASWCALPTEKLLPALILGLDESREKLQKPSTAGGSYNFYTDANLTEVKKLIVLLQNIRKRFIDLKRAWPEHATIGEVLKTSNELLDTRHTESIAKLLTKTEQLHSYIHEWQVVASREYSAVTLYDQLTNLLVSWRRLELSTWARLLDMEDEKCIEDVRAWWFITYEVIVAAPLSIINSGQDLRAHVEHLLDTLAEFFRTTSIGHYILRLELIECFVSHVELLSQDLQPMQPIVDALRNFLSFYQRYHSPVQESVRKGRQALEKDMKEILLLASWKDTNINALRDSAKRSHHNLFKVLRKYRALLAQPAQKIFERGIPDSNEIQHPPREPTPKAGLLAANPAALRICEETLPGWAAKPTRFKDPAATATNMARMTELPASSVDSALYLDTYASVLVESMRFLQKETPATVTKSKGNILRHLKTRKRKLFTDTLKDIRQMGFKSNMSGSALAEQASLSRVLADSPALNNLIADGEHEAAESYFHRLLDLVSQIRASSRDHSEDISHVEVSRAIGNLESILSVILEQRATLATGLTSHKRLVETTDMMQNLWMPEKYKLQRIATGVNCRPRHMVDRLEWLPGLLEAGCTLLKKHADLGDIDNTIVIEGLVSWKQNISNLVNVHRSLAKLPEGLSSSLHDRIYQQATDTLEKLKADLEAWRSEHPKVGFVLRQLEPWADNIIDNVEQSNGVTTVDLMGLDRQVSRASDSLLVAVQRVNAAMAAIPTSTEHAAWLIGTHKSLSEALKCFRSQDVAQSLNDVMRSMQHLPNVNGEELGTAGAAIAMALPIVSQFCTIQQELLHRYAALHRALCKLASALAQSLSQLISHGFCGPADSSTPDAGKTDKLESGTGLGVGEGEEDISKDVQDDEDLSELAQDGAQKQDGEDIANEEDAVDMNHDELEGEMGDASGTEEEGASGDEKGNDEIDEETGKVDYLDPGAVDEKLWDGGEEDSEKEKEGSKGTGKTQNDEQMAGNGENGNESPQEEAVEEENDLSDDDIGGAEEVVHGEAEKLEPHLQEETNLDLPQEMDIDRDNHSTISELQGSDLGEEFDSDAGREDEHPDAPEGRLEDGEGFEDEDDTAAQLPSKTSEDADGDAAERNDAGSPADTEPEDDGPDQDQGLLRGQLDNAAADLDKAAPSDAQGGQGIDQHDDDDPSGQPGAEGSRGEQPSTSERDVSQAAAKEGELGQTTERLEEALDKNPTASESTGNQAFKKLGDALEKWHRQQQRIREASMENALPKAADNDVTDQILEHLQDENTEADTQALGAATEEQAHALDRRALETQMREPYDDDFLPDELDPEALEDKEDLGDPEALVASSANRDEQSRTRAFIGANHTRELQMQDLDTNAPPDEDEQMSEAEDLPSTTNLPPSTTVSTHSPTAARRLWSHYETLVHPLSLALTEQLRLILTPTQATKMRGDFRTGKRLNIKRIIPYIASNYKRDKIWMRRSVPQKRNYQIMLAVDDSKSMGESGSGQLAFEALVLVSKSLSMLEVGEICIVGFGEEVKVAHHFDKPFTPEAGINVLQQLGFKQTKTNVRKLVSESITLFREAKAKAPSSSSSTELWQLLLIMSDGLCEDHDEIRRLVRQAQEERIMIVFVIVDGVRGESIVNMSQAIFEDDTNGEGGQKLKIKRYLEGFPFMYYLVVGDVKELPGVLATALRQWFSEVVGQGG